jgi:hypothetical protein
MRTIRQQLRSNAVALISLVVALSSPAHKCTTSRYRFIPTERVLGGLMSAGFVPVQANQAKSRQPGREQHARHVVRLRRRFDTIQLKDSVPEIVFLNSHLELRTWCNKH